MRERREARVDVWHLSLALLPEETERLASPLSSRERAALDRISQAARRERTRIAWVTRRVLLARRLACDPHEVVIVRPPGGAPVLGMPGRDLRFSLSHSGDAMLFAVSDGPRLGVDIERIDDRVDARRLARRFFTETEASALALLPEDDAREQFFRLWTRKEAVLKGLGGGVPSRLRAIAIERLKSRDVVQVAGQDWLLDDLRVTAGYAAALAVQGEAAIRLHNDLAEGLDGT